MRQLCLVSDPYHIQSKPFPCKKYTFFPELYHSICSHLIQPESSLTYVWGNVKNKSSPEFWRYLVKTQRKIAQNLCGLLLRIYELCKDKANLIQKERTLGIELRSYNNVMIFLNIPQACKSWTSFSSGKDISGNSGKSSVIIHWSTAHFTVK